MRSSVLYVSEVHLFIHTNFSKDPQRPYSKNNFGVLYYEVVSSPFLLFKSYLDIIDRVIFNLCEKNLLPVLMKDRKKMYRRPYKNYSRNKKVNKLKENVFLFACKLIKWLTIVTCQRANPNVFIEVFKNYKPNIDYRNPHLSIDRHIQEKAEWTVFALC